ncbi:hypothetical protein FKM82_023434, partial [Ascaphus truei]
FSHWSPRFWNRPSCPCSSDFSLADVLPLLIFFLETPFFIETIKRKEERVSDLLPADEESPHPHSYILPHPSTTVPIYRHALAVFQRKCTLDMLTYLGISVKPYRFQALYP